MQVKQCLCLAYEAILDASIEVYMAYNLYFSINIILRTTHNVCIPTIQHTIGMPMRPLTSDCTVLIWYGQYLSIASTIYGRTCMWVWCSALLKMR